MPNNLLPLAVPWDRPSCAAGAIGGGEFAYDSSWGCQTGITEQMLRTIPVIDRLPAQWATHRIAEFHFVCTVNVGKWWRWLASFLAGIQLEICGGVALISCAIESSAEPAKYAAICRERFVVVRADGARMHIWPRSTLEGTTFWSEW